MQKQVNSTRKWQVQILFPKKPWESHKVLSDSFLLRSSHSLTEKGCLWEPTSTAEVPQNVALLVNSHTPSGFKMLLIYYLIPVKSEVQNELRSRSQWPCPSENLRGPSMSLPFLTSRSFPQWEVPQHCSKLCSWGHISFSLSGFTASLQGHGVHWTHQDKPLSTSRSVITYMKSLFQDCRD